MSSWEKDLDKMTDRHNAEYEALEIKQLVDYIQLCKRHGRQPWMNSRNRTLAEKAGLL